MYSNLHSGMSIKTNYLEFFEDGSDGDGYGAGKVSVQS